MTRWTLVVLAILPACTPDASTLAAAGTSASPSLALAAAPARVVVRGAAGDVLYGGTRVRQVSFGAAGGRGTLVSGTLQVTLGPAARGGDARAVTAESRFVVTCLEVVGTRAWVGVRPLDSAASADSGGDVWYVEDGGDDGVDRMGVWVGLAPDACLTRPAVPWALPVERGEVEVTVD